MDPSKVARLSECDDRFLSANLYISAQTASNSRATDWRGDHGRQRRATAQGQLCRQHPFAEKIQPASHWKIGD